MTQDSDSEGLNDFEALCMAFETASGCAMDADDRRGMAAALREMERQETESQDDERSILDFIDALLDQAEESEKGSA